MHKRALVTLISAAILPLSASAALSDDAGFGGEISINTGYMAQTSNFNTDGDEIKKGPVNSEGSSEGEMLIMPLGKVNYTFGSALDKQVYLGTSREDIAVGNIALELGYTQEFADGMTVDVSFLPTMMSGETWANPYLVDQKRETTDESGNAYRLQVENIYGSDFSLDMAYATLTVDDEKSGHKDLDRNGNTIYLKASYQYGLDKQSALVPSLIYKKHSADGSAMAYDEMGTELTYFRKLDRHQFAITADYSKRSYNGNNPIFNKTRSDNEYSLFAAYEYQEAFGLEDWSLVSFAGYGNSSSNIEFYKESEYLMSVGMNFEF
ncbi:DUF2860 domain-containing protein [Aliivibrio kagoshimensis]|uniref:DUF2860 domain-containing protein n=1 Tax=Aliivibrio kagoshimensis TaxID=2910230 RepID=UPI003D0AF124